MADLTLIDLEISQEEQKEICDEDRSDFRQNNVNPESYNLRRKAVKKKPSGAELRRAKTLKLSEAGLSNSTKRQRTSPEMSELGKTIKRPKEDKKSFSDVLKSTEVIIKPINYPESIIDEDGVQALERHLLKKIDMLKIGESAPQFHQRRLIDGYWKIKCIGQESKEWLNKMVQCVRLRGCLLELVDVADMTQRPKCRVFVPGECSVDTAIMHRFKVQNPTFEFRSWRILSNKRQYDNEGRNIVMEMTDESVDALSRNKWYLAYGLTQVRFHLIENGSGGKVAKTDSDDLNDNASIINMDTGIMDCEPSVVDGKVDDI
ncbi:unnamed protein product [Chironomus riparius]|uniref:DUF4780 domain-containing protein n=1 Tax=Chironomus riparius TaxID=315576 RepID=A0A9N9RK63_9DIPT|nr:unnamed protein product [Chironomus riparius]